MPLSILLKFLIQLILILIHFYCEAVNGRGFIAKGITFRNTAGPQRNQSVALRSDSDLSVFYRCGIFGYQDSLYAHSLRQFYRECRISGTVDFIFGNAAAVLQECTPIDRPLSRSNSATFQRIMTFCHISTPLQRTSVDPGSRIPEQFSCSPTSVMC